VLDLGCRGDRSVRDLLDDGYDAFGCDFAFPDDPEVRKLVAGKRLRHIEQQPYRLPFGRDRFDFVFSNQVFEHVQNYPETIAEIARILKPGGASLHVFPSRYALIEPHIKVPFAATVQSRPWLSAWARLGVRAKLQVGLSAAAVAKQNREYLEARTNYLSRSELRKQFGARFSTVTFCLRSYFKHYPARKVKRLYLLMQLIPFSFRVVETLSERVVFLERPAGGD
jgi:SAM-dependent methyltransferase